MDFHEFFLPLRLLRETGYLTGTLAHMPDHDKAELTVETISEEALKTSESFRPTGELKYRRHHLNIASNKKNKII